MKIETSKEWVENMAAHEPDDGEIGAGSTAFDPVFDNNEDINPHQSGNGNQDA